MTLSSIRRPLRYEPSELERHIQDARRQFRAMALRVRVRGAVYCTASRSGVRVRVGLVSTLTEAEIARIRAEWRRR